MNRYSMTRNRRPGPDAAIPASQWERFASVMSRRKPSLYSGSSASARRHAPEREIVLERD